MAEPGQDLANAACPAQEYRMPLSGLGRPVLRKQHQYSFKTQEKLN